MLAFLAAINEYQTIHSIKQGTWQRLLELCKCDGNQDFDFRLDKQREKERRKLVRAGYKLLIRIMEAVEGHTQFVPIRNPFDQLLEIRPASPAPPAEDSPAFRHYRPYVIDIFNATAEADSFRCFLVALRGKDARRIRKCIDCGSFFWARRLTGKACSNACRARHWQKQNPQRWARIVERRKRKDAGVIDPASP